jgi:hypothetical protein
MRELLEVDLISSICKNPDLLEHIRGFCPIAPENFQDKMLGRIFRALEEAKRHGRPLVTEEIRKFDPSLDPDLLGWLLYRPSSDLGWRFVVADMKS